MTLTSNRPPKKVGSPDDFHSPPWVLDVLMPYIPRDWVIWESAAGQGNLVMELERSGHRVIATDILRSPQQDFLDGFEPVCHWDCQITNPPFGPKDDWLLRSFQIGKPFALLLPVTLDDSQPRQAMFAAWGIERINLWERPRCETPTGRKGAASSPWQALTWATWGLGIGREVTYPPEALEYARQRRWG